jgi:acyl-CoA synthetase
MCPEPVGILEYLAAAGLSKYDLPEFILCLAELPLTASGKLMKRELVRWVTEGRVKPQPVGLRAPAAAEG